MNVNTAVAAAYQGLFNLMSNEHGLNLTKSEMDEIIKEAQKVSGLHWIAISEHKPVAGQWLLVYAPSGRHIAWYNGHKFDDRAKYNIAGVTHWMQIPEPNCL